MLHGCITVLYPFGMARRPTLTQERLDRLRDEYEAWDPFDPDGPSASDIAARHGVSKNTMYTWRSRGWRLDGREGEGEHGWQTRNPGSHRKPTQEPAELEEVVRYLTDELVKAKIRIAQLEDQLTR
jgi:transposase